MAVITTFILSLALLLLVLAFISLSRQKNFLENYARDLEATLNDAKKVKEDLNFLLDNAVKIAARINNELHEKINYQEELIDQHDKLEKSYVLENGENIANKKKIRVYQAAKYLGMDSKVLITILRQMGYKVNSQLNTLDVALLDKIKAIEVGNPPSDNIKNKEYNTISQFDNNENTDTVDRKDYLSEKDDIDDILEDIKNAHPYMAVRALYERGYTIKEIAKFLGRGQGEVQILLNLAYKNRAI
ncbi:translation initiation factor IF-2 N-terminal domain-containing protein [Thermosyntropha lipolytica]|uniref:translation initiation factor IF-2 N-terminal domain-containing protein n=1 Tax=Thermosyntropha lipolytica TaxID=54294 RepID=UPI00116076D9|nr:translation initiation factor IF-2 N-terminal domain-containing protein [Thermosyntropha lipolytica]